MCVTLMELEKFLSKAEYMSVILKKKSLTVPRASYIHTQELRNEKVCSLRTTTYAHTLEFCLARIWAEYFSDIFPASDGYGGKVFAKRKSLSMAVVALENNQNSRLLACRA